MPKQVQFTKEIIINEAIDFIRKEGIDTLSARSLSKKMGCSVAPLFYSFANMEELMAEVRRAAGGIVASYLSDAVNYNPAFKEFGLRLVRFSKEDPKLFHYLFLDRKGDTEYADTIAKECLKQTKEGFGITEAQVQFIYAQIWTFLCGLTQLCSKSPEIYTEESVSKMLSTQFQALLMLAKSEVEITDAEPHLIPEGERVYLRKWRQSDAATLFRLASDPDVGPRAGWLPHKSEEESLDVIRKFFLNDTTWAIVLKESGEIVGSAGYHLAEAGNIPLKPDEVEVGYWVAKSYWNQGICTEALKIVIEHCVMLGGFKTLYGEHFIDNPASGRVLEKCGFSDTGQRRTCPTLTVGSDKEVRVLKLSL